MMSTDLTKSKITLLSALALMAGISGTQPALADNTGNAEEASTDNTSVEFDGALPLHVYNDNDVDDDNRYFEITAHDNTAFEFEIETKLLNQNNDLENQNVAFDINLYDEQGYSVLNYTLDMNNARMLNDQPALEDVYREKRIEAGTYLMSIALNYGSKEGLENQSHIRFSLNGSVEEIS